METSEELQALRNAWKRLSESGYPRSHPARRLIQNRIADLAADEEVAVRLKRSQWYDLLGMGNASDFAAALRAQLDATP